MEHESVLSDSNEIARNLARFLDEIGAQEAVALDIADQSGFADAFVIAGAASQGQLQGFHRRTEEYLRDRGFVPRNHRKRGDESGWLLLDCGTVIVHLMLREMREFYELEKLWFDAKPLWKQENDRNGPGGGS